MALSSDILDRAKRFKIYRNGDNRFHGKEFVLNRRRIRNWDAFLQQVTNDTKSNDAVRSIRTPVGGTRILDLDELQDNSNYVAVCSGTFKKMGYLSLEDSFPRKAHLSPRNHEQVRPVEHSRIQVSGRIRKIPTDVLTIYVYANGKPLEPARRVTLTRAMIRSWEAILSQVTEKVNLNSGAARRLCTVDGQTIANPTSLQSNNFYVAVGADIGGFKKLDYGTQKPAFNSSPKQPRRKLDPIMGQRRGRKFRTGSEQTGTASMENSITSTGSSDKSHKSNRSNRNARLTQRKLGPRKPEKKEEESVFHARPVKHKRSSEKQRQIDYDRDEGGVFKAQGRTAETTDAQEVEETKDTQVDLPIDQIEAEEVEEEPILSQQTQKKQASPPRSTTPKFRTPTPPQQTRVAKERTPTPVRSPTPQLTRAESNKASPPRTSPKSTDIPQRTPTPAERILTPRQATPLQNEQTPTPKDRTPTPKRLTPSPKPEQREATPAEQSQILNERMPTPKERMDTPKERTPTPKEQTPTPQGQTPTPKERGPSAGAKTPTQGTPAEEIVADHSKEEEDDGKNRAATKIQANYRGYRTRKEFADKNKIEGQTQENSVQDKQSEQPQRNPDSSAVNDEAEGGNQSDKDPGNRPPTPADDKTQQNKESSKDVIEPN